MEKKLLNSMFDNLLHIGNKTNYWNPRMKSYIYGSVNGVHIINLVKTAEKLEEIQTLLTELSKQGKKVLFVATKLQARDAFQKLAEETGNFYVTEKWVPGLLTNFKTIKKRIATYLKLLKDFETNAFEGYTKKELAAQKVELDKLHSAYQGLKEMKKLPDLIFVVDSVFETQAVKEANSLKIDVVGILNTNGDDLVVSNLIPANTNAVKSITFLASELKKACSAKPTATAGTNEAKFVKTEEGEKISGVKTISVKKVKKEEIVEEKKEIAEESVVKEKASAKKEKIIVE